MILSIAGPAMAESGRPWTMATVPAPGVARAIGSYANGCIQGAMALPFDGPGWRVLRPQRNRNWGHPLLIATIRALAGRVEAATGKTLLVADITQPRGGPSSGHASHQIGLDADIRFQLVGNGPLDPAFRREGTMLSMLADGAKELDRSRWQADQLKMLRIAAELPEMDRIFVNPVIKREACRLAGRDRAWLNKVIPWYGHDDHMHIRVRCPDDSPQCRHQAAIPAGDGCGAALAWWFTSEPFQRHIARPHKPPVPPAACGLVWRR
ncbi:MAG: penicillin-insensitive murein endopeptidase [Rhodospirillaceae bacterium]|nr:penicillin-insensitive murein endopeptidase [Rhodospirillaceae bacterium]